MKDWPQVDLRLRTAYETDLDEASVHREAIDVPRQVVSANDVENDVDAASRGGLTDGFHEVLRAVIDRDRRAERLACPALLVGSRGRVRNCTESARELDRCRADAARTAVNENALAFRQPSALKHVRPDGEEGFRNRGGVNRVEAARYRKALHGRRDAILGVATSGHQGTDARLTAVSFRLKPEATWFLFSRLSCSSRLEPEATRFDNFTGDLEARNVGGTWRRWVLALSLHDVGPVHARGLDPDEDFLRTWRRHCPFDDAEHFRSARLSDFDCTHPHHRTQWAIGWYKGIMGRALFTLLLCALAGCNSSSSEPTVTSPGTSSPPVVVVLGDSLTAGPGLRPEDAYPALLQERARSADLPHRFLNAGISGDTSGDALRRLDNALVPDTRVLVVALGANDGLQGVPVDTVKQNLRQILERARGRNIRVLICGMESLPNNGVNYAIQFHNIFPELATEFNAPLMPFLLQNVFGRTELNLPDGFHPNAAGMRVIASEMWPWIEPLLRATMSSGAAASR